MNLNEMIMSTKPNDPTTRLTKREEFAARAMAGIVSNKFAAEYLTDQSVQELVANVAVQQADALIRALNRKESE